ncbi:hypothetical protein AAFG13_06780 [Bradyrhizobium sp. B124]|uniref:hypothetical protein n=1 Tax=Bradyrhizobium sp. B124 TaxID=3140245 RepID=UPI00318439E6
MSVASIPDSELLRRAVIQSRARDCRKGQQHARWEAVMDNFLLGSSYAVELCRRFDLDPDELVKR